MDKFLHGEIPFERLTLHPFPLLRIHFDTRRLPVRRGTCVNWHVRKLCHCCPFLRLWSQVHVFHVLFAFHHKFYFLPRLCIFPQLSGIMPHRGLDVLALVNLRIEQWRRPPVKGFHNGFHGTCAGLYAYGV